jgi:hypothetical protein
VVVAQPARVAFARSRGAAGLPRLGAEIVAQTALVTLVLLPSRPDRRKLGAAAAAVVLALLLAMPALLGVQSLVAGTARGAGFSPAVGFSFSLPKALLLDLVLPRAFGRSPHLLRAGLLGPAVLSRTAIRTC